MNRFASLVFILAVPACNLNAGDRSASGMCPAGETCSDATPHGLNFDGASLAGTWFVDGPAATAIGGVQDVTLTYVHSDGSSSVLDQPFAVDDGGGSAVASGEIHGPTMTMHGVANGENLIRIVDAVDDTLYDRKMMGAAELDSATVVPGDLESVSELPTVFWTGPQTVGVALYDAHTAQRLVDTGMTIDAAGATRRGWDTVDITSTSPGTRSLTITAGDKPAFAIELTVVNHVDAISKDANPDLHPDGGEVCFTAHSGASRIVGAPWSFAIDNGTVADNLGILLNCVRLEGLAVGTAHLTATAGDQSVAFDLAVTPASNHKPSARPAGPTVRSLGERAALMSR